MSKTARGVLAILLITGTATAAMAQGAAKLHTTPNSVKYKSTGAKPATGRSGSATLEARVLIAKDNTMLLEAATAGVESSANPGTITKMQVKIGADFTQNHNGLNAGGFWSNSMPAAMRATSIQLQANIKGIDPKRNDVVTVSTPALFRPDIAVLSVSNPLKQAPNALVAINATVAERNGDVGARGACVLSIDGTVTATTPNIWVDAGDTVNCQFTHAFAQPGTHAISVAVTGVTPGDWDMTNNAADSTIEIVNPNTQIPNGYLQAHQEDYEYTYEYSRSGGYYCDYGYYYYCSYSSPYSQVRRDKRNMSHLYFQGWSSEASLSPAAQFSMKLLTNGSVVEDKTFEPIANQGYDYDDGDSYQHCRQYYTGGEWNGNHYTYGGYAMNMCAGGARSSGQGWTNYWFERLSGTVSYFHQENGWVQHDYSYTYGDGQNLGWASGAQIGVQLAFVDASGAAHTADKSVTLNQNGDQYLYVDGPRTGYNQYEGSWSYYYVDRRFSVHGWTDWYNQQ